MSGATGSNAVTVRVLPNGETRLSSGDPWYRLFRALADLYLAGEIDIDDLADQEGHWATILSADLDKPAVTVREFACPAAREMLHWLAITWMEPECLCDPYRETPCGCPPADRRARLRELIGD